MPIYNFDEKDWDFYCQCNQNINSTQPILWNGNSSVITANINYNTEISRNNIYGLEYRDMHCFYHCLLHYYEQLGRSFQVDFNQLSASLRDYAQHSMSEMDQKIALHMAFSPYKNVLELIENSKMVEIDFLFIAAKTLDIPILVYLVDTLNDNNRLMFNSDGFNNVSPHEYANPPMYLLLLNHEEHFVILKQPPL